MFILNTSQEKQGHKTQRRKLQLVTIRDRFNCANSFAVYYGTGLPGGLTDRDVLILEPSGQNKDSINLLHKNNCLLLSYISLFEISPASKIFSLLDKDDLLHIDGVPIRNDEYGNYLADIRSEKWRHLVFSAAEKYIYQDKYDGLFLDTIGNVEWPELIQSFNMKLVLEGTAFIEEIRQQFKNQILVQNNGLSYLFQYTHECLDGVCWENPPGRIPNTFSNYITEIKKTRDIKVMLLTSESYGIIHSRKKPANSNGYLYYNGGNHYLTY